MKLVSFSHQLEAGIGLVEDNGIRDLRPLVAEIGGSLKELIEQNKLTSLAERDLSDLPLLNSADLTLLPVIPDPGKVFCIGINYARHIEETGMPKPNYPMVFTRFADAQVGHEQPLVRPNVSTRFDYEGELAVIIGKPARYVKATEALDYVAGYSCFNDGSVRDWQMHTSQFTPGKNFPASGAFGPWLVTADEIPDPARLQLITRLNGEVMQNSPTDDLLFDVPALIEYLSACAQLNPGDVIVTGTPGGAGAFRDPKVWMKSGDRVEVEISGIGVLSNPVVEES